GRERPCAPCRGARTDRERRAVRRRGQSGRQPARRRARQLRAEGWNGSAHGVPMSIGHWTQSHRRSILFLLLMLALAGVVAAFRLPVSLFPTVDFPRAVISLDAGDQPAEQME